MEEEGCVNAIAHLPSSSLHLPAVQAVSQIDGRKRHRLRIEPFPGSPSMFGFLSSCAVQPAVEPLELSLPTVGHCLLGVGSEGKDRMGTAIRGQGGERPQDGSMLWNCMMRWLGWSSWGGGVLCSN